MAESGKNSFILKTKLAEGDTERNFYEEIELVKSSLPHEERRFISENLTHSFYDSDYADFFADKSTEIAGFSVNPNFFRSTGPETVTETLNGEFKYEFFYEVPPTKEVFRAFFLNIQFLGTCILPKNRTEIDRYF